MKKIIVICALLCLLNVGNSIYAAADINILPKKSILKPGEEFYIDVKLVNADVNKIRSFETYFECNPKEAITPLSVVGYKPTPPVTYRTNFASGLYPYYAGTSVSKLADSYLNNEIIYTIKCKVNENFKGKTFQMIFNNMEISMNSDFEMVYPLEKSVNFTIVNTDIINTIVQYKLDPTYIITIPEKIIASDSLPVEISINGNVNLEPDKQVKIAVSTGNIVLNRHKIVDQIPVIVPVEEAGTITANLRLGSNNTILSTDTIALFEFGQENLIKTKLYLDPIITTGKKAGMYIGNIIFNLSLINK